MSSHDTTAQVPEDEKQAIHRDLAVALMYAAIQPAVNQMMHKMSPVLQEVKASPSANRVYFLRLFFERLSASIRLMEAELVKKEEKRAKRA
jgi:hypothetical protein